MFNASSWVAVSSSHFITQYLECLHLKILIWEPKIFSSHGNVFSKKIFFKSQKESASSYNLCHPRGGGLWTRRISRLGHSPQAQSWSPPLRYSLIAESLSKLIIIPLKFTALQHIFSTYIMKSSRKQVKCAIHSEGKDRHRWLFSVHSLFTDKEYGLWEGDVWEQQADNTPFLFRMWLPPPPGAQPETPPPSL